MNCREAEPMIGPYFDDELDVANALAVEQHLRECAACQAELDGLRGLRSTIRDGAPYYHASEALGARVRRKSPQRRWLPSLAMAAAALFAGIVIGRVAWIPAAPAIGQEVLAAHLRSLQAGHLMDVVSTDRHTVKPWFTGKLDFAPEVEDLAGRGFRLEGGRLDYVGGRAVAALVYSRRQHTINVFIWPSGAKDEGPDIESRHGFALARWTHGGTQWWAVSDVGPADLRQLAALLR